MLEFAEGRPDGRNGSLSSVWELGAKYLFYFGNNLLFLRTSSVFWTPQDTRRPRFDIVPSKQSFTSNTSNTCLLLRTPIPAFSRLNDLDQAICPPPSTSPTLSEPSARPIKRDQQQSASHFSSERFSSRKSSCTYSSLFRDMSIVKRTSILGL